ncbi:hypothetical protein I8752_12755 [Nostocaceae cyanobacterium CENA369]|uniref:Uncharacterized protein n=1 Tax=Dendronalium phyllosphericum CENA369 TaxID=1725256 RepID=A0A8J7I5I5_9NOST|nr:hypothetical protein [Dendronalium phyllosphericum]MBH8573875.1 hypothetical protein [Dendronalium phyllosphericum CENA369]
MAIQVSTQYTTVNLLIYRGLCEIICFKVLDAIAPQLRVTKDYKSIGLP